MIKQRKESNYTYYWFISFNERSFNFFFTRHSNTQSRRDQEEGDELDSQKEASPDEIKSKEVVVGYIERAGLILLQFFCFVFFQRRSYGHCLCDSVLHSSWDSSCVVRWSLRNAGRTLPLHPVVLAAVHGSLGLPGWRLFRGFTLLSLFPTRPRP